MLSIVSFGCSRTFFSGPQDCHVAKGQWHIVRENQSWAFLQQFSDSTGCENSFIQFLRFSGLGAFVFESSNQSWILFFVAFSPDWTGCKVQCEVSFTIWYFSVMNSLIRRGLFALIAQEVWNWNKQLFQVRLLLTIRSRPRLWEMAKSGLQMGGSGYELASSVNLLSCTSRLFLNATWLQFSVNLLSCTLFFFPLRQLASFSLTPTLITITEEKYMGMWVRSLMWTSVHVYMVKQ